MVSDQAKAVTKWFQPAVLILVLMEDGLWPLKAEAKSLIFSVLILVLMEDGLWQGEGYVINRINES